MRRSLYTQTDTTKLENLTTNAMQLLEHQAQAEEGFEHHHHPPRLRVIAGVVCCVVLLCVCVCVVLCVLCVCCCEEINTRTTTDLEWEKRSRRSCTDQFEH